MVPETDCGRNLVPSPSQDQRVLMSSIIPQNGSVMNYPELEYNKTPIESSGTINRAPTLDLQHD